MKQGQLKSWISPFVAVLYGAVALSGVLMLFHLKSAGVGAIHEWGGIAFVVVGTVHLVLNWNVFVSYFRNKKVLISAMAGVVVIILVIFLAPQKSDGIHGKKGNHSSEQAYSSLSPWVIS